jgi:hypothetical protein
LLLAGKQDEPDCVTQADGGQQAGDFQQHGHAAGVVARARRAGRGIADLFHAAVEVRA